MSKGGSQTVHQRLDPQTQAYVNQMRQVAAGGGGPQTQRVGPGGMITRTTPGVQGGPIGGAAGVALNQPGSFFTGPISDADIQSAMNPYMQNVIGGVRGEYDHLRGLAGVDANQQATQQGAFGGSRHAVMQGARMGELDRAQTSQIGGLLNRGYQDARGFAEHQRQLQQQQLQEPLFRQQQALGFLNMGLGPHGTSTTQPMQGNPFGSAIGGGLAGYGVAGPWGAGIGALGGLLGGLF